MPIPFCSIFWGFHIRLTLRILARTLALQWFHRDSVYPSQRGRWHYNGFALTLCILVRTLALQWFRLDSVYPSEDAGTAMVSPWLCVS